MRAKQQGSALIVAIALIVVLAAIAAGISRLVATETQGATESLQRLRVVQAANLGLDVAGHFASRGACAARTFSAADPALSGITITTTCVATNYLLGAAAVDSFALDAQATYGIYGQLNYASASRTGLVSVVH